MKRKQYLEAREAQKKKYNDFVTRTKIVTIMEIDKDKFDEELTRLANNFPDFQVIGYSGGNGPYGNSPYVMTVKFSLEVCLEAGTDNIDTDLKGPDNTVISEIQI
jgi:hypothetical protein